MIFAISRGRKVFIMQGTVKWFSNEKGYGFITGEDANDYFVHHTAIQMDGFRTLDEGDRVEFETQSAARGPQAVGVAKIE